MMQRRFASFGHYYYYSLYRRSIATYHTPRLLVDIASLILMMMGGRPYEKREYEGLSRQRQPGYLRLLASGRLLHRRLRPCLHARNRDYASLILHMPILMLIEATIQMPPSMRYFTIGNRSRLERGTFRAAALQAAVRIGGMS